MKLVVFFAIGESFKDFKKKGQSTLIVNQNIKTYSKAFEKVYITSYEKETYPLFNNCYILNNNFRLHRYLYSLTSPFIHIKAIREADVLRGYQLTGGIPCLIAKLLFKKPFVINYGYDYSGIARIEGKNIQAFFYKCLEILVLRNADVVIATTNSLAKKIKLKTTKVVVVPNGVDTKLFFPKKSTNKLGGTIKIISVGRLEPQKNYLNLLKAVVSMKEKVEITLIGTGDLRKQLYDFAKNNKLNLKIIDSVPHNQLPSYLRASDIFVLPSLKEGNPKSLLEAMSCGLPIVGTQVEGIKEIIRDGKTGIITGTNAESLKSGIENLVLSSNLVKKIGINARKYIERYHNYSFLLRKEVKVLKEAARI